MRPGWDHCTKKHRVEEDGDMLMHLSCVARSVDKAEIAREPKAKAALDKEWDRLRAINTWDESGVQTKVLDLNGPRASSEHPHNRMKVGPSK